MRVHSLFSRLMYLVLLDLKHKDGFDQGTVVTVQKVKLEINVNILHPLLIITALTSRFQCLDAKTLKTRIILMESLFKI